MSKQLHVYQSCIYLLKFSVTYFKNNYTNVAFTYLSFLLRILEPCPDETVTCSPDATCTLGGFPLAYRCECNEGFEGDGIQCKGK